MNSPTSRDVSTRATANVVPASGRARRDHQAAMDAISTKAEETLRRVNIHFALGAHIERRYIEFVAVEQFLSQGDPMTAMDLAKIRNTTMGLVTREQAGMFDDIWAGR